jgi:TRAP-type mannitol/chloroaromatic compound transport system permease small subunit
MLKNFKDFISGIIFFIIGAVFNYFSNQHQLGDISQMGPGLFPLIISSILMIAGIITIFQSIKWKS